MNIVYFGHSSFPNDSKEVLKAIKQATLSVLDDEPKLYCGWYGKFDELVISCIKSLKKEYPQIKFIFVTPYLNDKYYKLKYAKEAGFDEVMYTPLENTPPKYCISKRNDEMAKLADCIIALANPTLNFSRISSVIRRAEKRGTKIIYVNKAGLF